MLSYAGSRAKAARDCLGARFSSEDGKQWSSLRLAIGATAFAAEKALRREATLHRIKQLRTAA
eukprot:15352499-Heterocapsa_arctica.AAC.1